MPRAGFSSVHIPRIPRIFLRPDEEGVGVLAKVRFGIHHDTPTAASQAAGEAFVNRLMERKEDREPVSGPELAQAQMMAFGIGRSSQANVSAIWRPFASRPRRERH